MAADFRSDSLCEVLPQPILDPFTYVLQHFMSNMLHEIL